MKTTLIISALAMLVGVVVLFVLGSRPDEPITGSVPDTSRGPSFEVQVVRPRIARPLFGILPTEIEAMLRGDDERFDHASRGAEIGNVGHDRLELSADGWDLAIEADETGRVASGTRLVYPFAVGGRQVSLRCRPADPAIGYLHTTRRAASDELDGRFHVELITCENARTGKTIDWPPARPFGLPPAPLTVRGSFEGLPQVSRQRPQPPTARRDPPRSALPQPGLGWPAALSRARHGRPASGHRERTGARDRRAGGLSPVVRSNRTVWGRLWE
jgi:hypothetical protein